METGNLEIFIDIFKSEVHAEESRNSMFCLVSS